MRNGVIAFVCLCFLLIAGCSADTGNRNQTDNYLETIWKNKANGEGTGDSSDGENLFPIPSLASSIISIRDIEDNVVSTPVIEYTGGRITYKLVTGIHQEQMDGPEKFNRVFYILIDGYLQPFYFEGSDEPVLYMGISADSSDNLSEYTFSFEPMYVPYGKNSVLSFIISDSPDYIQQTPAEQVFCSSIEQNYCLTAADEKYAVDYKKKEIPARADIDFLPGENQTIGFILAEKIQNENQFKVNTLLKTDEQLYATTVCTQNRNSILYAVVDGQLANVFNGSYFADVYMDTGKTYEIPLDMDYFSKNETHQIYFVEIDKNEIDNISKCSTGEEIMAHALTDMVYAYAVMIYD